MSFLDHEEPRQASTPNEMRQEIFRLSCHDPLVRKALDHADRQGLSGEDKYVILSYYALTERHRFKNIIVEGSMTRQQAGVIQSRKIQGDNEKQG